ncbi:Galectin [Aphelenchoides besseyi]|nr:Galectin [Aphelenchoides besseyi]
MNWVDKRVFIHSCYRLLNMSQAPTVVIPVPFRSHLTHPLEAGQTISIHGHVKEDAKEFQLNLLSGSSSIDPQSVVALHCQFRFDENKLVLNSLQSGKWEKEERKKNTLHKGEPFDLRIRVHDDRYEILVNGKEVAEFTHPIQQIDHLEIRGDVQLNTVKKGGRYHQIPYETSFHGGELKTGQSILISGIPTGDRFEINLIDRQGNIVFHLNPRLNEKKVVRSAFINGEWGPEEREGPQPFKKDTAFDIVIQNQPYSLQVFVNGQRFTAFAHRTADPQTISYYAMKIDGNVEITGLEVSYPQDNNVYEY